MAKCVGRHVGNSLPIYLDRHEDLEGDPRGSLPGSPAIQCAMAVQRELEAHNSDPDSQEVHVRIGLAAGEPVAEDDDLYGTAVNLAARVCGIADAGAVFVTDVVKELAVGKNFEFEHIAEVELKGFPNPVPVSRVVR